MKTLDSDPDSLEMVDLTLNSTSIVMTKSGSASLDKMVEYCLFYTVEKFLVWGSNFLFLARRLSPVFIFFWHNVYLFSQEK
jgi:hypothetical protein